MAYQERLIREQVDVVALLCSSSSSLNTGCLTMHPNLLIYSGKHLDSNTVCGVGISILI